jgi:enoyl-CoA hydratase
MSKYIKVERSPRHEGIQIISIDRPPRNAMSLESYKQLLAALQESHLDESVLCVILTGAGDKSFVAGGDLNEHAQLDPESAQVRTSVIRQVFNAVRSHRVPVIAAVNGFALGGGLALMASCDIVVATDTAKFSLPEVKVGIMGGTRHLRRIVPDKVVRMMAFTGNFVDARYFHALGVIQEVVPQAELMNAATQIAQDICQHSPACIRLMKETINLTEHMELDEGYHVECYATSIIKSTPEAKEAVQAALEKRKPNFRRA